jgi:DNA-binding MarR family transcriptional regulator
MTYVWQMDLKPRGMAATVLPPAMVDEAGWDILLALHSDPRCELDFGKLSAVISIPPAVLTNWLVGLERRQLITGRSDGITGDVRVILTAIGRELLDKYLSATSELQISAHH